MTTEPQNTPLAETKHTELPWGVCVNSRNEFDIVADGGGGDMIADLAFRGADAEADADFIVRACNAHDDLVAALKDARSIAVNAIAILTDLNPADHPTIKKIDAALAKANGGAL